MLPSSCAAACDGPTTAKPRETNSSATPATSGASGPTTVQSTPSVSAMAAISCGFNTVTRNARHVCGRSAVSRNAVDSIHSGILSNPPSHGVLSAAAANYQYLHRLFRGPAQGRDAMQTPRITRRGNGIGAGARYGIGRLRRDRRRGGPRGLRGGRGGCPGRSAGRHGHPQSGPRGTDVLQPRNRRDRQGTYRSGNRRARAE